MAFYHDQHLAWQQRVNKELSAASRFLTQYGTFNRPHTSTTAKSVLSKASNHDSAYLTRNDLRHLNVYAEVRGKYARPPPPNQTKTEIPLLTPKENNIVSRPATSGSLRPRSHSYKSGSSRPVSAAKQVEPKQNEVYKRRYRSVAQEDAPKVKEIDRISFEKAEKAEKVENDGGKEEEDEEVKEEMEDRVEELEENPEEFRDQGSQITTSSQRRYILELEALLREEKMRRYQLEESLKKVIGDKK